MSSKSLCSLVRIAVIAVAICGLIIGGYVLPSWGTDIVHINPEFGNRYLPWLIFLWAAALPCFFILAFVWKVSIAIKAEEVFTIKTAKWIKVSADLLFGDTMFFFLGNIFFMLLGMSHPGILLLSIFVVIFGVALAVLAAVLSRYITKAAALQEEADGTI